MSRSCRPRAGSWRGRRRDAGERRFRVFFSSEERRKARVANAPRPIEVTSRGTTRRTCGYRALPNERTSERVARLTIGTNTTRHARCMNRTRMTRHVRAYRTRARLFFSRRNARDIYVVRSSFRSRPLGKRAVLRQYDRRANCRLAQTGAGSASSPRGRSSAYPSCSASRFTARRA